MTEKRKHIDGALGIFDDCFRQLALKHGFTFEKKAGPSLGRALRIKNEMERGVFLELDDHWPDADISSLNVILGYSIWLRPYSGDFPLYLLKKSLFIGKLHDLTTTGESLLSKAVEDVKCFSATDVARDGKYFEKLP
jgi:hypothetical protein